MIAACITEDLAEKMGMSLDTLTNMSDAEFEQVFLEWWTKLMVTEYE